jgi:hypothetical protein
MPEVLPGLAGAGCGRGADGGQAGRGWLIVVRVAGLPMTRMFVLPAGCAAQAGFCCPRAEVPGRPGLVPHVTGSTPAMSYRITAVRSDL